VSSITPPLPTRPSEANLFIEQIISGATSIAPGTTDYWAGDFTGFAVTGSLSNAGLLWGSSANGLTAVQLIDGGSFSNTGTVVAEAAAGDAVTIDAILASAAVSNSGELFALAAAGNAYGVHGGEPHSSFENGGMIAVQAFGNPADNLPGRPLSSGKAVGIFVDDGDVPIVNQAAGQILVEGDHAFGIWMRGSAVGAGYAYDLDNQGLIQAESTLEGAASYGLYLVETAGQQMRVLNSGTIEADVAVFAPSEGPETLFSGITYGSESITNSASGRIDGAIELRNGGDLLVNSGQISGLVDMGPGDDRVDTAGGTLNGPRRPGLRRQWR